MGEHWLVLETSGRGGRVGLAVGGVVAQSAALDPARRHNRDLAPSAAALLEAAGLVPRQLHGVMVSMGPGSYTGLRVGLMSAKMLAYAVGCRLVAVPTFHAIAAQTPGGVDEVTVTADGLQGLVYAQPFRRINASWWEPGSELWIGQASEWAQRLPQDSWVTGPGVDVYEDVIGPSVRRVPAPDRIPGLNGVLQVGLRLVPLEPANILGLEPLYLRPSSAEEKATAGPGR